MNFVSDDLKNDEKAVLKLRQLYRKYGYTQFKMSKFEEYDLYVNNKDFLVSDRVITFTGAKGKLLALKPDVTISIIRNSADVPGYVKKVYYNENVFRVAKGDEEFKEIMQTGLECIGDIDMYNISEVIMLAIQSLESVADRYILDISHLGFVKALLDEAKLTGTQKQKVLLCIENKNIWGIKDICYEAGLSVNMTAHLTALASEYGPFYKVLPQLEKISINEKTNKALSELKELWDCLDALNLSEKVQLDFSVVNDMNYYNGIVFKGYIEGASQGILSGGQYDKLMKKMGKESGAIGFAVYLDLLQRLDNTNIGYDVDDLILYDTKTPIKELACFARDLVGRGNSVLLAKKADDKIKYRQLIRALGGRFEVVEANS
ncbi:MAG: ATP phosphoribosyltransferase regulatory subunit [Bacillota bacterium]|nr:ATP phosphoribosyltransferase regulatory subunit [Bacillota bacterium]